MRMPASRMSARRRPARRASSRLLQLCEQGCNVHACRRVVWRRKARTPASPTWATDMAATSMTASRIVRRPGECRRGACPPRAMLQTRMLRRTAVKSTPARELDVSHEQNRPGYNARCRRVVRRPGVAHRQQAWLQCIARRTEAIGSLATRRAFSVVVKYLRCP